MRGSSVPLGAFAILWDFLARIKCVWRGASFFSATSDLTRTGAFDFAASERAAVGYLGAGGAAMAMGTVASAGGSGATVTSDGGLGPSDPGVTVAAAGDAEEGALSVCPGPWSPPPACSRFSASARAAFARSISS